MILLAGGTFMGECAGTAQDRVYCRGRRRPKFDSGSPEFAAAVFLPLGVDPHSEGVFPFRGVAMVAVTVVSFGAEVRQLGEAVMPYGFVRCGPGVLRPAGDPGEALG
jgi:hypothetical protein